MAQHSVGSTVDSYLHKIPQGARKLCAPRKMERKGAGGNCLMRRFLIYIFRQILSYDIMKEGEVGRTCSTNRSARKLAQYFSLKKLQGKKLLGIIALDWKLLFKRKPKKHGGRFGLISRGL
jgi:hypothetical protein